MKRILIGAATGAVGLGVGLMLAPLPAQAGHSNALVSAHLNGRAEVSTTEKGVVGDPNGRGEAYVFGIDGDPTTLCYILEVSKIAELDQAPGGARMAHIHKGAKGTNGPVEVNLAFPQGGQAADCLTEGEAGKGLDPGEVQQILANPSAYYVNVHNTEFPGGAVRGQLHTDG
ncbi:MULTISPECIES: CHRD domain-containing protein [unclassified Knoellia]|uniref:CHRD domain-containing protein n=1 Tax=Knoellia altitudinis TaxID=3404795 RepID=UPI00361EC0BF